LALEGLRHLLRVEGSLSSGGGGQAIREKIEQSREEKFAWVSQEGGQYGFRLTAQPGEKGASAPPTGDPVQ
jgi:hypothetical protein